MVCHKRGFIVWWVCYMSEHVMRENKEVWAQQTFWDGAGSLQSGEIQNLFSLTHVATRQNILKHPWEHGHKQLLEQSSEGILCGNVCEGPGKLEPWSILGKLLFSLLGTLKSNGGEEILEGSTFSSLVTHESFTTGKISVMTYNKNVIHL